jgi:nitrogen fixation protein NifU and related proteins
MPDSGLARSPLDGLARSPLDGLARSPLDDVRDLYSDAILAHARRPAHRGRPEGAALEARGSNPMCGDRVDVFVRLDEGGRVAAAGFEARSCDVCAASADLMCEIVPGLDLGAVRTLAHEVGEMARTGNGAAVAAEALRPLSAVHEYPSRLRCVTLPWSALVEAMEGDDG